MTFRHKLARCALAAVLVAGLCPASALATTAQTTDDSEFVMQEVVSGVCGDQGDNLTWTLDTATGALTIQGTGSMRHTASQEWFQYRDYVKSITIAEGVTGIGYGAFTNFTSLESVSIPGSIGSTGQLAFSGCTSLTSVSIAEGVAALGKSSFYNCTALTSISIPASVTDINPSPFSGCTSLRKIFFKGDAPNLVPYCFPFYGTTDLTAYYPAGNATWTEDVMRQYEDNGGNVTWSAYSNNGRFPDVSDPEEWFYQPVYRSVELGLFKGYSNGTFGPMNSLTRSQFAVVLWRYLDASEAGAYASAANATGMPDVADNAFYTGAVNWAVSCGYITGYENGTFGPNDPITAEQMCVILERTCKGSASGTSAVDALADAAEVSSWAREGCAWALENGVLSGYDNGDNTRSLRPSEPVYRARAAVILVNAIEAGVLAPEDPAPAPPAVGDIVTLGTYEQDNDPANGSERIEWRVLDVQNGKALLVSRYALDCQPYNTDRTDVTWETCTLRSWLNGTFYNAAFSEADKARIATTHVANDDNPDYGTSGGNDTDDNVFCLSIAEVGKYFDSTYDETSYTCPDRMCAPTAYAVAQGAYQNSSHSVDGIAACCWWLRSAGLLAYQAAYVLDGGRVVSSGIGVGDSASAVRPALWVNL